MKKTRPSIRLNGFQLKYIALFTMAIDHTSAVLLPGISPLYEICRGIGRLAFPIYCFLLVEGYFHTSSKVAYLTRLFLFALLSEIPFDLAFYHFPRTRSLSVLMSHQNVFFTLTIAFLAMWILDHFWFTNRPIGLFCALLLGFLAEFCHFDYGLSGVIVVLLFFRSQKGALPVSRLFFYFFACFVVLPVDSLFGLMIFATVPLLACYDGTKGTALPGGNTFPGAKYLFYGFYPVHLALLGFLWLALH